MEQNTNYVYEDEMEIDLKELFFALLNKWHLIVLSGFLCALIGLAAAMFVIPEKFESKTSIYIYNQQSENMTYTDLQTGSTLTKDYEVLVKGRTVLESAIEKLDLGMTYEQINGMVTVTVPASTRIVEITVESTDPYLSRDIADAVREIASKNIAEVMGVDAVNVVETANLPEKKSSPSAGSPPWSSSLSTFSLNILHWRMLCLLLSFLPRKEKIMSRTRLRLLPI